MSKLYTKQLLKIERKTVSDEELDCGILKGQNLNKATLICFALYQSLMLFAAYIYSFSLLEISLLTIISLYLARQTALDFAYHVMLDVYTFPLIIATGISIFFIHSTDYSNYLSAGLGLGFAFFAFTQICCFVMKKPAGLGYADAKFIILAGFLLGWLLSYISIVLACIINFIITFFYKDKKNVPMGPGFLLGFWLCFLYGEFILSKLRMII